jgi:hypothetical protein
MDPLYRSRSSSEDTYLRTMKETEVLLALQPGKGIYVKLALRTRKCQSLRGYHTLRSEYLQAIKWSLHRRSCKLANATGAEWTLHYYHIQYIYIYTYVCSERKWTSIALDMVQLVSGKITCPTDRETWKDTKVDGLVSSKLHEQRNSITASNAVVSK